MMNENNPAAKPLVSIIVPTHKRPVLLARALKSIQLQTYQNFEVIVVENGCEPEAEKVLEHFREQRMKVRYLYDKTPSLPNARNLGIREASADLIAFLDDDDEWVPEKLEKQMEYLTAHPSVGLVACRVTMTDEEGRVLVTKSSEWSGDVTRKVLLEKGAVIYSPSCILIKKELCEKVKGFDTRYKYAHDLGFYFAVERRAPLFLMEEPLVIYHVHKSNMSSNSLLGTHDESVQILKELVAESAGDRERIQNSVKHRFVMLCNRATDVMDQGDYAQAAGMFRRVLWQDPWVGLRIHWGRINNSVYFFLRPFGALAICVVKSLKREKTNASV